MTPRLWRVFYALFESEVLVRSARWAVRAVSRVTGRRADGLLAMFERRFVYSGWPHQRQGWVNLHMSRFVSRVRRERPIQRLRASARVPSGVTRIGFVGPFSGLLGFPSDLFEACPENVSLHVFDIEYYGALAPYLQAHAAEYLPFPGGASPASVADAINRAQVDLLLTTSPNAFTHTMLDHVMTPYVAFYCGASDLLHHERVDVQLLWQPEADYLLQQDGLFCCTTEQPWTHSHVRPITGFYDRRGVAIPDVPNWDRREPLMVFHGSLDKLAGEDWRSTILRLLQDDSTLQFVFMGKDRFDTLRAMLDHAHREGVHPRVHYEGTFSAIRAEDGTIHDPGWARMVDYMRRARLAPNPWPMGGGSSRFEAYLAGTPSVHMGLRTDRASWRRRQYSVCELPLLHVPDATATTIDGYVDLCRRCLYDGAFADRIATEQLRVADAASDARRWWAELVAAYDDWYRGGTHPENARDVAVTS